MSKNNRTFIIADLSTNHEGNVKLANEMIEKASECGADFVLIKLDETSNVFTSEEVANFHKLAEKNGAVFTTKSLVSKNSIHKMSSIQKLDVTNNQEGINNGAIQMISSYLHEDTTEDNKSNKTVDLVKKTQQPFPKHKLQLLFIGNWKFQKLNTWLPEVISATGTKAISCKFTLDDKHLGYDHAKSTHTRDFRIMVTNIRTVEVALGTGKKTELSPSEVPCFKKLFKSIVAARHLMRGSKLKEGDIKIKVSATQSMSGFYFSSIIGQRLLTEVDEDDPIFVCDIKNLQHYMHYLPYNKPVPDTGCVPKINLGRRINLKSKCYIIAEIGKNHQGEFMVAKKLIKIAKKCGADCVKFQKTCLEEKCTWMSLVKPYDDKKSFGSTYEEHKNFLEFTEEQYKALRKYAEKKVGIHFTASAMDPVSLDFLVSLKVPFIKIGSGEAGNMLLLEKAAKSYIPLVISTGMMTLADIRITYETVSRFHNAFALLHCVSAYPTPPDDANLNMIKTLRQTFPNTIIGYSGHEVGSSITAASVALGAKIVERHITLDRNMKGSDHICSLEPSQFSKLVSDIRCIESNLAI